MTEQKEQQDASLALIHLPIHTQLSLDGCSSQTLKAAEDLLVIRNIPHGFHLLTCKAASIKKEGGMAMNSPIGLLMYFTDNTIIAREFDSFIEELKSDSIDEISLQNLEQAIQSTDATNITNTDSGSNMIDARKLIHYRNFVSTVENHDVSLIWKEYLTNCITKDVLQRHELTGGGDKIVPGMYHDDQDTKGTQQEDGRMMHYIPIPCMEVEQLMNFHSVRHKGTRRFLSTLLPTARTKYFIPSDVDPAHGAFQHVLQQEYQNQWGIFLGEFQMSFCIFVCCSCLSSLEFWKDSIYMLSLVNANFIQQEKLEELYLGIVVTLKHQLEHFDCTVLQEEDYSNGNILVPAIQKICFICKTLGEHNDDMLKNANALVDLVKQRFNMQSDIQVMQMESTASPSTNDNDNLKNNQMLEMHDSDDDDEDGPVIVGLEEYQASMERNATIESSIILNDENITDMKKYKNDYPFLFAALESGEDILMACARILDEKKDVTLVREAANFLENIERCR